MNEVAMGLGLLVVGVTFVFLAGPWWARRTVTESEAPSERESLVERREAILTALRDLDFDHTMGKLETEDYTPLRQTLLAEAASIMAQWDEQVPAGTETRALAGEERACPRCDRSILPGDLFCAGCGLDLTAAQMACRRCGRSADPWDLFCRNCGDELAPVTARSRWEGALEIWP